jgi:hypothetical protein
MAFISVGVRWRIKPEYREGRRKDRTTGHALRSICTGTDVGWTCGPYGIDSSVSIIHSGYCKAQGSLPFFIRQEELSYPETYTCMLQKDP